MKTNYETRMLVKGLEIRAAGATPKVPGSIGTVEGYAAKFNSPSRDLGGFLEILLPGCFKRSLALQDDLHDPRALFGHDKNRILARRSAGTLEIAEDEVGLKVSLHLIDTTDGRDTLTNTRAGNLDAWSFGFRPVVKPTWSNRSGVITRSISDADLFEVSVVSWAQYGDTELSARELELFKEERKPELKTTPLRLLRQRQAFWNIQQ